MNMCAAVSASTLAVHSKDNSIESADMYSTSTRFDVKNGTNIDTKMQDNSFSPTGTRRQDNNYLKIRTMLPPSVTVNHQC